MVSPISFENPILVKELRTRMRGAKAFWILFFYLGILSVIVGATYFGFWQREMNYGYGSATTFQVGRQFYAVLFVVQAALVGLITPALTSGAISIEKEQRTYEALSVSPLPRRSIVFGKLGSALAFVVLLLMGSLPLVSVCFLLGGVSPAEVATAFLMLIVSGFLYGAIGMAFSSFVKTTTSATVLTYGTIIVLFGVTLCLSMAGLRDFSNASVSPTAFLVAVNPVGAMAAGNALEPYFGFHLPAWLTALSVNGLLGVIFTLVALHRIEYPKSDRSPLLRVLTAIFVGLIAFYAAGALYREGNGSSGDNYAAGVLFAVLVPVLFLPLFVTGEKLPAGPFGGLALKLRDGNPVSGLTYVVGLVLLSGAIFFVAGMGYRQEGMLAGIGMAVIATLAFGAFALWLTQKLKNRWGVMAIVAAAILSAYFLPLTSMQRTGYDSKLNASVNALYLSPVFSVIHDAQKSDTFDQEMNSLLVLGDSAMSPVTSALYGGLGLLFLGLTVQDRKRKA